jgi:hypothetical protein
MTPRGYQPLARRAMVVAIAVALSVGAAAPAARAQSHSGPTAVVSMGDSYISGEAGRWAGNSIDATPGNDGTDRACVPAGPACQVDKSRVYVDGTDADGCHRSDVAEVLNADLPVAQRLNIACSGAVTGNLLTAQQGGTGQNGEQPQGDLLAAVARTHDIRAIVVSIGGNDLGFAGIISRCLTAYVSKTGPCKPTEQPKLQAALPAATTKIEGVIDSIRGVMHGAGYADGDYRLIMQTYPSVAPPAARNRFAEADPRRVSEGCANYDEDLDWAHDQASAEIDGAVATAASARGAELMDLHDLFNGHEVCATTAAEATALSRPSAAGSEWGRYVSGSTVQQGDLQEAFHPNAFGQRAFGTCLTAVYKDARPGRFACAGAAGEVPTGVQLLRTDTFAGSTGFGGAGKPKAKPRLRLSARRLHRAGRATCFAFTVRAASKPVARARVRFASRTRVTGRHGRATICRRVAAGRHRVLARRAGYRSAHLTVRARRAAATTAPRFTG